MARKIYRPGARKQRAKAARARTDKLPRNQGVDRELLISGKPIEIKEIPPSPEPESPPNCIDRGVTDSPTPRKRSQVDLRNYDPSSSEYWELVLKNQGLTPTAGGSDQLTYVGTSEDLANVERRTHRNDGLGGGRRARSTTHRD